MVIMGLGDSFYRNFVNEMMTMRFIVTVGGC